MSDDRNKCDKIIREAFFKITQVILQTRILFEARKNQLSKWFNLHIEEVDAINQALNCWRFGNIFSPLFIDIFYDIPNPTPSRNLVEHWEIIHESCESQGRVKSVVAPPTLYKNITLTLRMLYSYSFILPADKFFREWKKDKLSSNRFSYECHCSKNQTIFSPSDPRFTVLKIASVDTGIGTLSLNVYYRTDLQSLKPTQNVLQSQLIIQDYQSEMRDHPKIQTTHKIASAPNLTQQPYSTSNPKNIPIGSPSNPAFERILTSPASSLTVEMVGSPSSYQTYFSEPTQRSPTSLLSQSLGRNSPHYNTTSPSSSSYNSSENSRGGSSKESTKSSESGFAFESNSNLAASEDEELSEFILACSSPPLLKTTLPQETIEKYFRFLTNVKTEVQQFQLEP